MARSYLLKLAISLPLLVVLILMDEIEVLQGLPLLLIAIGVALVAMEPLRIRLTKKGKAGIAMLPFMAASLVLMFAYCWRRDLSQAILFVITVGVVFDILLVALAAISETSKRGLAGASEFAGLMVVGLAFGFVMSLILTLPGRGSGISMAGP
jgi:membrane protein CcdC involved in cytochrome C biogenesis